MAEEKKQDIKPDLEITISKSVLDKLEADLVFDHKLHEFSKKVLTMAIALTIRNPAERAHILGYMQDMEDMLQFDEDTENKTADDGATSPAGASESTKKANPNT